jgi:hypothetical protein
MGAPEPRPPVTGWCLPMARRKQFAFDDPTFFALKELASSRMATFQDLADEAFADLLKKHRRPIGLKAALKQSIAAGGNNVVELPSSRRARRKKTEKPRARKRKSR